MHESYLPSLCCVCGVYIAIDIIVPLISNNIYDIAFHSVFAYMFVAMVAVAYSSVREGRCSMKLAERLES